MVTLQIITAVIFLIYFAIYEGANLAMKDALQAGDTKKASKWDCFRHGFSTLIRFSVVPIALVPVLVFVWPQWWMASPLLGLFIFLSWTGWNTILNLQRGLKWYYRGTAETGTNSWLDKFLKSNIIFWGLQILDIIITITLTIIFYV